MELYQLIPEKKMTEKIRLGGHQLASSRFDDPKALVQWMGAVQAQDYAMAKWAVGIRLKTVSPEAVNGALDRGEILRTHVMRPTWHFVAGEDLRWMLKLSYKKVRVANESFDRGHDPDLTESLFRRAHQAMRKVLEGGKSLTKQELCDALAAEKIPVDMSRRMARFTTRAEIEGVLCSGPDKEGKVTYALLDERVPAADEPDKKQALIWLAERYFRSHAPATLRDFVWWSGLSVTEAREAVAWIGQDLAAEERDGQTVYVHRDSDRSVSHQGVCRLLPSYDEYLIGYKDRSAVLDRAFYPRAFNNWGIFYPVILYEGRVVGNWKKTTRKGQAAVETSFFEACDVSPRSLEEAKDSYLAFLNG